MSEGTPSASKPKQEKGPETDTPEFVKDFSRESNIDERNALAEKIRAERGEHSQERREQSELEKEINELETKLDDYNSSSFLTKVRSYFEVKKVRASLGMVQERKAEIDTTVAARNPNRSGQEAVSALYEKEKERWANAEYGKEDIAQMFTEEHLASLSVEDYALLMKRFPSEMVTHVTRQGIRDHTGMWEHTAGTGAFHNGFEKMLDDGSLKSPLAIKIAESGKEEAILGLLNSRKGELPATREEALARLESFMSGGQGSYADRAAIHFAAEEVADRFYGSEKGNEIFIAYPSAFIGSQYHFSHGDIAPEKIGDQHNDAWVLSQEDHGIKLDAGLVFIPQDAQVDPKNGSRYEIGPDNKPIKNMAVFESLKQLTASPELSKYTEEIQHQLGSLPSSDRLPPPSAWESELEKQWPQEKYANPDVLKALIPIRDKIKEVTGVNDDRILQQLFRYSTARGLEGASSRRDEREREGDLGRAIDGILEESGTRFAEAKNTISSEEYWNSYFATHPDKKPSKVVFYSGGDPTKAMYEWRRANGLNKQSGDTSVGFEERKATTAEAEVSSIKERAARFETLARSIIEERYQNMPAPEKQTNEEDEDIPPPLPPNKSRPRALG
ncbi:hypothetical protein HY091_02585 [Candidatus Kaiserbacteria bacterium]|nr:hypothetical protein [Candidatus Kaiserbacteria bacterium]